MDSVASLLEAYRRDRRRLLGFLLSSAGGHGGRAVDLSRVDLDAVSADYALDCVASGKAALSLRIRSCVCVRVERLRIDCKLMAGCVRVLTETRRAV